MTRNYEQVPEYTGGPLDERFAKLVDETLELWHVPGISIAVVDGDKTWAKGYGIASFPSTPVTPFTLFYAGSTTKAFTAAILSLLVDDNDTYPEVQWDTPICQLIRDDFVLEDDYCTNHITIEDALSHRTGMPRHDLAYGGHYAGHKATVKDIVRSLRHLPLTAELRTKYQYCNTMFVVASHVIETLTSSWLGDLMAKLLWTPLGMYATFFSTEDAKNASDELARGYYYGDGEYHQVEWMNLDDCSGAGSVVSNVLDYARWARALMRKTTPLSEAGQEAIWRPRTHMPYAEPYSGFRSYCFGWVTGVYQGHQFYEHTGGMNAFGAELIIFPDLNFSVVAFANTATTSNYAEEALVYHLIDEKLGLPKERRFDWNKKNLARVEKYKTEFSNARERLFPSLPSPILPPTASLADYKGTYWHPGYHYLTVYLDKSTSTLRADRADVTWPEYIRFEHVSGDFFVAIAEHMQDLGAFAPSTYATEFRIGADGKPCAVGIGWEEMMKEKIWLKRT